MQSLQHITKLGFFYCFIIKNDQVKEDEMDRHVACMGRRGKHIGFRWEGYKERDH
jgi:hypothetical protein